MGSNPAPGSKEKHLNEQEKDLPNFVFGAMDVMPLVELSNEIYDICRQHPSLQTSKPVVKWMTKFNLFMREHQYTKPPTDAIAPTDNKYLKLVADGIQKGITDKMKDQ